VIYIVVTAISMIISSIIVKLKMKSYWQILAFLPLTFLGALRAYVGIDYTTYSIIQIPGVLNGFSHIKFEPLAKQVVFLGYYLADRQHYFYIFSLFHIILMWFIYKYISENSKNISESLFLLLTSVFFTFSLSGIRQAISTMIAFYALKYLEKNKVFHFIFFIIIASLFHKASIIYLFFIVLNKVKLDRTIAILGVFVAVVISLFNINFVAELMEVFDFYSEYIGSEFYTGGFDWVHKYAIIIFSSSIFIMSYFLSKENIQKLELYLKINYILFLSAILMSIFPTPSRIIYLFIPVYFVLIPNILFVLPDKRFRVIVKSFYFILFTLFFYRMVFNSNVYETLPYQSIFEFLR